MTAKYDREAVAHARRIKIVEAKPDESPEYWLASADGDEFPINLDQLHDVMDVIAHLHDHAHDH